MSGFIYLQTQHLHLNALSPPIMGKGLETSYLAIKIEFMEVVTTENTSQFIIIKEK